MRSVFTLALAGLAVVCGTLVVASALARQQLQPQPQPADLPDFVISDMRVQEFPERNYLYQTYQTTIAQIGPVVQEAMGQFGDAIMNHEIQVMGPPVFVYKGATGEMDKPFELQIGFPVVEGTRDQGDMKVRTLEKYRCATVLYSGAMKDIGQAYMRIFPELQQAGLEYAGDSREMHLYFESPESPNNIVLIQVGVK